MKTMLLTMLAVSAGANPVVPGDYPDPSVSRDARGYWSVATTSEWAPLFPVLRSDDLKTWKAVSAVFQDPPAWTDGQYWAPEIRVEPGRTWVYYAARKRGGPICVTVATAAKPEGPYKDHGPMICQDAGSIDGFPVKDADGKRYLFWKEDGNSRGLPTPIWVQELSKDGVKLVGEKKEVLRNDAAWEGALIEGPALLKRGDWWYMFYAGSACCTRTCDYAVGVARAKSLLGPWEKNPANPIVRSNADWICPGHGTAIEGPDGRLQFFYHAISARDSIYPGRQGVIDPVEIGPDGWPVINGGLGAAAPSGRPTTFVDEFEDKELSPLWQWPRGRRPSVKSGSGLTLAPSEPSDDELAAILARSTTKADYKAVAVLRPESVRSSAGLAAIGSRENALGLSYSGGKLAYWMRKGGKHEVLATAAAPAGPRLHLRLSSRGGRVFRAEYGSDGEQWTQLGGLVDGDHLPPWDLAVRVGLTARGPATFDSMRVE